MRVLVANHCSWNKGDRAVLFVLVRELLRNGVEDITVSTANMVYWAGQSLFPPDKVKFIPLGLDTPVSRNPRPGLMFKAFRLACKTIKCALLFPIIRRHMLKGTCPSYLCHLVSRPFWDAVTSADLVISTGGHRITTLLLPDAVGAPVYDLAVASLLKKRLVLWSQTIGPLEFQSPDNELMVQKLLANCWRIMVRDEGSIDVLRATGIDMSSVSFTPESVFAANDLVPLPTPPSQRPAVVGISVYTSGDQPTEKKQNYIETLRQFIDHLAASGTRVLFFPMMLSGADRSCINAIIGKVAHPEFCEVVEDFPETPEHVAKVAQMRAFVGHKTHSVVIALAVGTPVVGIAYHRKTRDFMNQFGLGEYCVDDVGLTGGKLIEVYDRMQSDLDAVSQREQATAGELGSKLRDGLAELLHDARQSVVEQAPSLGRV